MKKIPIFIIVFCCGFSTAICQKNYWQQQVNYKIDVTLNDADNTLDGYVKMDYYNNSPDTLRFIWIQLWANAFKNDRTAFSNQLLENGRTDFYFGSSEQRGYINRLNFRVNNIISIVEDDPQNPDIIKLLLPQPLAPNSNIKIETPFHIKLPYNYSGNGYQGHSYQITQWYPKPAVYDSKGWHAIPYLTQGASYDEFGNYKVQITLPAKYIVAATGYAKENDGLPKDSTTKTWQFEEDNITDFAWFADKKFIELHDTVQSKTGKIINVFIYHKQKDGDKWNNSIKYIKQAINEKSNLVGEYPYNNFSIIENTCKYKDVLDFPCIGLMKPSGNENTMDLIINHLIGYSWFGWALASNQREHPWMDKGLNIFYDDRKLEEKKETILQLMNIKKEWIRNKLPDDPAKNILEEITETKNDQHIETNAGSFSLLNYYAIAYFKTAQWLKLLENNYSSPTMFSDFIKKYYTQWQFKHPYPEDFKTIAENVNSKKIDSAFSLLTQKGDLYPKPIKKDFKLTFLFNFKEPDKHNYICVSPAIGYNYYDQFMIGGLIHNYTFPQPKFEYLLAPLYSSTTQKFTGLGRLSYSFYPGKTFSKINVSLSGSTFTIGQYSDTLGSNYFSFHKIVPCIRFTFKEKNPRNTTTKYIQFKSFIITEDQLTIGTDSIFSGNDTSVVEQKFITPATRVVNQLLFVVENNRVLYPYREELKAEQGTGFIRLGFTGNYFFNYENNKGGAAIRLFAGKFIYTNRNTADAYLYGLNLSAPKGDLDYTYNNYFIARNYTPFNINTPKWIFPYQQIMMSDGGLKVNTDAEGNVSSSDNWIAALNGVFDIPQSINPLSILPIKIPLKVFADVGTYSETWLQGATSDKFLYDAGLQLLLIKGIINIYAPLLYSQVFKDYNTLYVPQKNRFFKTISFSIDIQNISVRKFIPQISF